MCASTVSKAFDIYSAMATVAGFLQVKSVVITLLSVCSAGVVE